MKEDDRSVCCYRGLAIIFKDLIFKHPGSLSIRPFPKPLFRCAKAQQTVYVGDVNDNSPIMSREHISLNLREDTPTGQSLLRIGAADADSDFGVLTFSLEQNQNAVFRVDRATGEIFLSRPIDFEQQKNYQVQSNIVVTPNKRPFLAD